MLTIRKATQNDVDPICSLSEQLGYPGTPAEFARRLDQLNKLANHAVFVAELANAGIVGWIHVLPRRLLMNDPMAEIGGIVVDHSHRGKRIGLSLIRAAEEWALTNGYSIMIVHSNVLREGAHMFYPGVGYELSKTQRVYRRSLSAFAVTSLHPTPSAQSEGKPNF